MKKSITILKFLLFFMTVHNIQAQQNAKGIKDQGIKSHTHQKGCCFYRLLSLGGGFNSPNSISKEKAYLDKTMGFGLDFQQTFLRNPGFSIGVNVSGNYFTGSADPFGSALPEPLKIVGQLSSSVASASDTKNTGYIVGVGPQFNFHLSNHFVFSPIFQAGYLGVTQSEFAAVQTTTFDPVFGGIKNLNLLSQTETKTSGLALIPKVRLLYMFNHSFGLWAEANYVFGPTVKNTLNTFNPEGFANATGQYNQQQINNGKITTVENESKYTTLGLNFGLVFGFGSNKQDSETKAVQETKPQLVNNLLASNPTSEPENCNPIIKYPLEGELFNSKAKIHFDITLPKNQKTDNTIRIYKVSDIVYRNQNVIQNNTKQTSANSGQLTKLTEEAIKSKAVVSKNLKVATNNSASLVLDGNTFSDGTYMAFVGNGNCGSNPVTFSVQSADVNIQSFAVTCGTTYGSYTYTMVVSNVGSVAFSTSGIMFSSPGGTFSSITTTPTALGTIVPPGGISTVTFTGSFNYTGSYPSTVIVMINGNQVGNVLLTSSDTEIANIEACVCHDCDNSQLTWSGISVTPNALIPGQYLVSGNINITGLASVYGIEMQIQSYGYSATPPACTLGVSTLEQSGVFIKGGSTINGIPIVLMNETVSGLSSTNNNISKDIKINSTSPLPMSIPIALNLGFPAPITGLNSNCCSITNNVCIKVKVFYDKNSCKSCIYTYCLPAFTN
jgi:hypothetical protein